MSELPRQLKHPNEHPLRILILTRGMTITEGLNWLQDRGHISDNAIELGDVASSDVLSVICKAGAEWAISKYYPFPL